MQKQGTVLEFVIASFVMSNEALEDQLNDVDNMNPAPALAVVDAVNLINSNDPIMAAWDSLLDKIQLFTTIVDGISKVWFIIGCLPGHLMPTGCLILGSSLCENGVVHPVYCA
jgi:hypothetical protein